MVLLDALACAFAASSLDPSCRIMASVFGSHSGDGACTAYPTGVRVAPASAALVNGALVHALNFDAVGEKSGHTAVACAAAPLAMAELLDASGRDLLVSAIVAAEVSARISYVVTSADRRPS